MRVKGRWKYLYRAIDKGGATLDFYLADRRNEGRQGFPFCRLEAQPGLDAAVLVEIDEDWVTSDRVYINWNSPEA